MSASRNNHWAICTRKGWIVYDSDGRAEIWETKRAAERRIVEITERENEVLHAELVEIS